MTVTAAALRQLHRVHQQLANLRDRLDRGPRKVKACETNIARISAEVDAAREAAQQAKVTGDRKQLDLKTGEQKITDYRTKLNTAASNKEYQTLLEQIAAAEMANSVLSDEILEGFDKIDVLEAASKTVESRFRISSEDLEKTRSAVQEDAIVIKDDITRLEIELVDSEAALPEDFKVDYQRVVRNKGADALAMVEDGVCTGCGQQITLNMQSELQLSKLIFCRSCGCLLYLPEI
jgi:hypothetical protein